MSLAKKLNENPAIGYTAVAVVLLIAFYLILGNRGQGTTLSSKWMYDLDSGRLVKADTEWSAPYDGGASYDYGPLGSAGSLVDAAVFACGDATAIEHGMTPEDLKEVGATLAFVSRSYGRTDAPPPAEGDYTATPAQPTGTLVATPGSNRWVPEFSGPGMELLRVGMSSCGGDQSAALAVPVN